MEILLLNIFHQLLIYHNFILNRCEDTEDDADFRASFHSFHKQIPLSASAIPLETLPEQINGKILAVEAFNYIDLGSDSDFEGRMVNYEINNVIVSIFLNEFIIF